MSFIIPSEAWTYIYLFPEGGSMDAAPEVQINRNWWPSKSGMSSIVPAPIIDGSSKHSNLSMCNMRQSFSQYRYVMHDVSERGQALKVMRASTLKEKIYKHRPRYLVGEDHIPMWNCSCTYTGRATATGSSNQPRLCLAETAHGLLSYLRTRLFRKDL